MDWNIVGHARRAGRELIVLGTQLDRATSSVVTSIVTGSFGYLTGSTYHLNNLEQGFCILAGAGIGILLVRLLQLFKKGEPRSVQDWQARYDQLQTMRAGAAKEVKDEITKAQKEIVRQIASVPNSATTITIDQTKLLTSAASPGAPTTTPGAPTPPVP